MTKHRSLTQLVENLEIGLLSSAVNMVEDYRAKEKLLNIVLLNDTLATVKLYLEITDTVSDSAKDRVINFFPMQGKFCKNDSFNLKNIRGVASNFARWNIFNFQIAS